jgi:hypothetical protein
MSILRVFAISFLALAFSASVSLAASVGVVTKVENQAQIGGATAVVGTPVQTNDELRTGAKSHLEVSFRDNTTLTLGENARVVIDRYVFNPEQSTGELALSTSAAAFRLATGKLSEMRDKKINVSAPFAALAVRGTDFWWGPIDGHFGALLVSNSRLEVGKEKCRVTLDKPGEGTDIKRGCPGLPYMWSPGQVAAALSTTSFGLALAPGLGLVPAAVGAAGAVGGFVGSTTANDGGKPKKPTVSDLTGGGGGPHP